MGESDASTKIFCSVGFVLKIGRIWVIIVASVLKQAFSNRNIVALSTTNMLYNVFNGLSGWAVSNGRASI